MDEADDLEAQIARANRRRRRILGGILGVIALVALTPCAIFGWNIALEMKRSRDEEARFSQRASAAQIREVDSATRAAEAQFPERASRWQSGMAPARAMVPRPDLGACSIRLPLRQPASAAQGFSFGGGDTYNTIVIPGRQGFPHAVARAGLPPEPPRVALARDLAERLREGIRRPSSREDLESIVTAARELRSSFWTYDVVFFPEVWEAPHADVAGTTFSPGIATGVAVLYDYQSNRVLCAGNVTAQTTSTDIEFRSQILNEASTLQSMLDTEFEAEVERAIARALTYRAGEALVEPQFPEEP